MGLSEKTRTIVVLAVLLVIGGIAITALAVTLINFRTCVQACRDDARCRKACSDGGYTAELP